MTDGRGSRWRRPWVLVAGGLVVVAVAVLAVWWFQRDTPPEDVPVAESTLDGYPARGSLVDAGGWEDEVEQAADVWRTDPPGGQEEPPGAGSELELLWAGDLATDDLDFDVRFELQLEDDEGEPAPAGRVVVLAEYRHVAILLAPLDADGERIDDYTVVGDDRVNPRAAAVSPAEGVVLLADEAIAPDADTITVAYPVGRYEGVVHDKPVHDGLLLDATEGIAAVDRAFAASDRYEGLVRTGTGRTVAVEDDALWRSLSGEATSSRTRAALDDTSQEAALRTDGSSLVLASLWRPIDFEDGRRMIVVAATADGVGGGDPWWVVSGAVPPALGQVMVRPTTIRLGTGLAPALDGASGSRTPPLAARWVEAGAVDAEVPQLVVVGSPDVPEAEVLTAGRTRQVSGAAALPAWEEVDGEPVVSDVVVVGRDVDGNPVPPLPAGHGDGDGDG